MMNHVAYSISIEANFKRTKNTFLKIYIMLLLLIKDIYFPFLAQKFL